MLDTHFAGDAAKLLTHAAYMPAGEKGWQPNASANQEGGAPSASALMEKLAIDYMVAYRTQGCQPLGERSCWLQVT